MDLLHTMSSQKAYGMNPEQEFGFFFGTAYPKVGFADISPPGTGATTPDCLDVREDTSSVQDFSSGIATPPELERLLNLGAPPGLATLDTGLIVPETLESIVQPPPTASIGSRGHPERCAEACKYIKRKGGCRYGDACPQCHLCFWQRTPAKTVEKPKDANSLNCVAAYSSKPDYQKDKDKEKNTSDADLMSIGSLNHPAACAGPCRYVNRKGGCRNGSMCPDCHFCHWRRNLPPKTNLENAPPANGNLPFSSDARDHLQQLIYLQLACGSSPPPPTTSNSMTEHMDKSESSARPARSMVRPDHGMQAHILSNHALQEALIMNRNLIAPPPGLELEDSRFFSTNARTNARFLSGPISVGIVSPR